MPSKLPILQHHHTAVVPGFNYSLTCHDPDEDDEHGYGDGEELGGGEAAAVAEGDLVAFAARPE